MRYIEPTKLVIDASNSGGGASVLLCFLAKVLRERSLPHVFLASDRLKLSESPCAYVSSVRPISSKRTRHLERLGVGSNDCTLLCFGNIPPLRKPKKTNTFTYFHNALLLASANRNCLSAKDLLKVFAIRMAIRFYSRNTDYWIVQTPLVKRLLLQSIKAGTNKVLVLPFFDELATYQAISPFTDSGYDFFYSSSFLAHKNHINLLHAIILLCKQGRPVSLGLTIGRDASKQVSSLADVAREKGAKIDFLGGISHSDCLRLTLSSKAIIFPSLIETVGLGLIEATDSGKPVLVSDLEWAKEIIETPYRFNPESPESIAETQSNLFGWLLFR